MKITQVLHNERIDPRDDMPQFSIKFNDGEVVQIEARDMDEAKITAALIQEEHIENK